MEEIHEIRLEIYEETKDMTTSERAAHAKVAALQLEQLYGIEFKRPGDPKPKASDSGYGVAKTPASVQVLNKDVGGSRGTALVLSREETQEPSG
jgi:hypothetical protein